MEKIKALLIKYREIVSYFIFGCLTTLVNWVTYALFVGMMHMSVNAGNLLSWVCAVSFAFVTNKLWVFQSKSWAWPLWFKEAAAFVGGRILSGLVELGGLPLLLKLGLDRPLFGVKGLGAKVIISIIVMIINYILGKFLAFRKPKDS